MNIIPTVGVIVIQGDQVLLVKHGKKASHVTDVYGWPGGRIDDGERLTQAAIRELEEETGLVATEEDLHPTDFKLEPVTIQRKNGQMQMFSADLFTCSHYKGTLRETDETIPEWIAIDQLDNLTLLPNVKFVVETVYKNHE
jgi:8-oxo-dGTP diphosphatase